MTLLRVIVASLVLLNSCSSLALSVEKKSHVSNQKQKTSKMNAFVNGQKTSEIRTGTSEMRLKHLSPIVLHDCSHTITHHYHHTFIVLSQK